MTKLPDGWKTQTLRDWGMHAQSGFASGVHNSEGNGVIHLRPMNVSRLGKLDFENIKSVEDNSNRRIQKGDILFNNTNSAELVGKTALVNIEGDFAFSNHMTRLRFPTELVLHEYMAILLHSVWMSGYFYEICSNHVNQASVSIKRLEQVEVSLPPIDEQQKIVELLEDHLSRLDAALADVKQAKVKAFQFRRSILHAAFTGNIDSDGDNRVTELPIGWEMRTLSNCLEKLKSGKMAERGWSPQCLSHPTNDENTWGVLKTTSVQMGEYQPQYNKELPESLTPKIGLEVNPGDFLVTTTGPRNRCGVICHVKTTPRKLIFSGKILRFRANEEIVLPNWLLYILMSPEYQTTLDGLKVGTSDSSVSIGNQQILDLVIPVPSIEVQLKILQLLEVNLSNLEASVSLIDSMEKQSGGLRRSLLQAAFSGQLTKEVAIV